MFEAGVTLDQFLLKEATYIFLSHWCYAWPSGFLWQWDVSGYDTSKDVKCTRGWAMWLSLSSWNVFINLRKTCLEEPTVSEQ